MMIDFRPQRSACRLLLAVLMAWLGDGLAPAHGLEDANFKVPTKAAPALTTPTTTAAPPPLRLLVQPILFSVKDGPEAIQSFVVNWPADRGKTLRANSGNFDVEVNVQYADVATAKPGLGIRLPDTPYLHVGVDLRLAISGPFGSANGTGAFEFFDHQTSGRSGGSQINDKSVAMLVTRLAPDDPLTDAPLGGWIAKNWDGCLEQQLAPWVNNAKALAPWEKLAGVKLKMPNRALFSADDDRRMKELGWTFAHSVDLTGRTLVDLGSGKTRSGIPAIGKAWPEGFDLGWDETAHRWTLRPDAKIRALPLGTPPSGDVLADLAAAGQAIAGLDVNGVPNIMAGTVTYPELTGKRGFFLVRTVAGRVYCIFGSGGGESGSIFGKKTDTYFRWYRYDGSMPQAAQK